MPKAANAAARAKRSRAAPMPDAPAPATPKPGVGDLGAGNLGVSSARGAGVDALWALSDPVPGACVQGERGRAGALPRSLDEATRERLRRPSKRLATSVASRLGMRDCGEIKGDLERCGWGASPVPTVAWMEGVPAELTVTVAPPAETARFGWAGGLATGVASAGEGEAGLTEALTATGSDTPPTEVETVTGPTVADGASTPSSANAEGAKARAANTPTAVRRTSCLRSRGDPIPTNASPWVCLFL